MKLLDDCVLGFGLLVCGAVLGAGAYQFMVKPWYQNYQDGKRLLAEDAASVPERERDRPRAMIPALGKCLTQALPSPAWESLKLAGVTAVESRAINVRYVTCNPVRRTNDSGCGWNFDSELVAYRDKAELLLVHRPGSQLPLGVRLQIANDQITALMPIAAIDRSTHLQDVCQDYTANVLGEVANQLQWQPAPEAASP